MPSLSFRNGGITWTPNRSMPYSSTGCRISSILEASSQEAPHTQCWQETKRRRRHIDGEELEAAQIEHKASEHHEAIDAFSSWLNELIDVPPCLLFCASCLCIHTQNTNGILLRCISKHNFKRICGSGNQHCIFGHSLARAATNCTNGKAIVSSETRRGY